MSNASVAATRLGKQLMHGGKVADSVRQLVKSASDEQLGDEPVNLEGKGS